MRDIVSPISGFRSPFGLGAGVPDYSKQDAAILASSPLAWHDMSNTAYLFQDTSRSTAVTASGDPVGGVTDRSTNGLHLTQSNATLRPIWNGSAALFDNLGDFLGATLASGRTSDMTVFVVMSSTDTTTGLIGGSSGWAGYFTTSNTGVQSSSAGTPTMHVNGGATISGTGALRTAWASGGVVVAEIRGVNLSGANWAAYRFGVISALGGSIFEHVIVPSSSGAVIDPVRAALTSKHGVS